LRIFFGVNINFLPNNVGILPYYLTKVKGKVEKLGDRVWGTGDEYDFG
jgi:hypothetical protein